MSEQTYVPSYDLEQLQEHPDNPRLGDDAAVGESIARNGFYGAVIAQTGTNRVLAGHTRRRALLADGVRQAPVIFLDVDDATARRILLADNRTGELASWDEAALAALLSDMSALGDLSGSSFTDEDLAALTEGLAVPEPQDGAPDPREKQAEMLASYENPDGVRQIVLSLARVDYERAVAALEALRAARELPTYAAVMLALIERAAAELEGADDAA